MDAAMRAYYDARAAEYDDWWNGTGLFADRDRPGWHVAVAELTEALRALPAAETLDVACGTGFLTRHLPGEVTAIDQSPRMVEIARSRGIDARVGDAFSEQGGHERVFTAHFYGHLQAGERARFLAGVTGELIVCDSAGDDEQWQTRRLNDGSEHAVYKRWFMGAALAAELGGGEVLHESRWFTVVRAAPRGAR